MDAREDHLENISEDQNFARLPPDWELTISDVSESTAVIGMYSRQFGQAYEWKEREGDIASVLHSAPRLTEWTGRLVIKERQHFWAYVAEYPSHFPHLPPGTEQEFVTAVTQGEPSFA